MKSRKADSGRASQSDAGTRDYSHLGTGRAFGAAGEPSKPTAIQRSWDKAMQNVTPRTGRDGRGRP